MSDTGAPSKYNPDMLPKIIELMSEGASLIEVAAEIGVNQDTIHDWKNPESPRFKEDFSEAIKKGVELSAAWWERNGRVNLKNKEFSATLWYMNMKNRFGWADNVKNTNETTHTFAVVSEEPVSKDEWLKNNKPE